MILISSWSAAAKPKTEKTASPSELKKASKGYSNLRAHDVEGLACDGTTEVPSLNSAQATFSLQISRAKEDKQSACDIKYDLNSGDKEVQAIAKFNQLLQGFCATYKAFYFDSPTLILGENPIKIQKLNFQDSEKKFRLVFDHFAKSIHLFHNGPDDIEVEFKKIGRMNVPTQFVFNPEVQGISPKATTDIEYELIKGIAIPKTFKSFVEPQKGHSFDGIYTLTNCKITKLEAGAKE